MQTDRLRDITKLIVTFCNFAVTHRTAAIRKYNWSFNNPGLNSAIIKYIPCTEVFSYCVVLRCCTHTSICSPCNRIFHEECAGRHYV